LAISGLVASQSEVIAIQNNTSTRLEVPPNLQIFESGDTLYKIRLYLYDNSQNMQDADSLPVIHAQSANGSSNDRDSYLSSTSMSRVSEGKYEVQYTIPSIWIEEQILFEVSVVVGGVTRKYGASSFTLNDISSQFTGTDRANLSAIKSKTDNLPSDPASGSQITTGFYGVQSSISNLDTKLSAVKAKTDKMTFDTGNRILSYTDVVGSFNATVSGYATGQSPEERLAATITKINKIAKGPASG